MQVATRSHLATITPIQPGEARRVINLPSLLMHNAVFVAFQTGWVVLAILSWAARGPGELERASSAFLFFMAMTWLICQFVIVFVYPEWPMNRWLASRLRRSVRGRSDRAGWVNGGEDRVVELVPRERWNQMLLDTATDLLLIRIDSAGVHMEGDCDRYELPCDSIMGVELHSIRPSGWFTDTHMVIIVARSAAGPIELPISIRDHGFGCLRNSHRREEALLLVHEINRITSGGVDGPLSDPTLDAEEAAAWASHWQTRAGRGNAANPDSSQPSAINPYAAPATWSQS